MKTKFDVFEALKDNGFEISKDEKAYFADTLVKKFVRKVNVAWYGNQDYTVIVKAHFNKAHDTIIMEYFNESRTPFKTKVHLNEKRAFNAIVDTLKNHGFAM